MNLFVNFGTFCLENSEGFGRIIFRSAENFGRRQN